MRLGLLIGIFLVGTTAFAQVSTVSCKKVRKFQCLHGDPAEYPDIIRCGDFTGFTKLPDDLASEEGDFELPLSAMIYSAPRCKGDPAPEPLSNCYYDSSSHGGLASPGLDGYLMPQLPSLNAQYISASPEVKGCEKAGIFAPDGKTQMGVCAAFITCRGTPAHFKICNSSGKGACPTADECSANMPSDVLLEGDKHMDSKSHTETAAKSAWTTDWAFKNKGKLPKITHDVVREKDVGPVVVRAKDGKGAICVVPYSSRDEAFGATTYAVAGARADKQGCPKTLAGVWRDRCVNPAFPEIKTYDGKVVAPPHTSGTGYGAIGGSMSGAPNAQEAE